MIEAVVYVLAVYLVYRWALLLNEPKRTR